MGIFYSISISDQVYQTKKHIKKIINSHSNNLLAKILTKNSLSVFVILDHSSNDFEKFVNKLSESEEKLNYKIITEVKLPEQSVINCDKINDFSTLLELKNCLFNELTLDRDLFYNDIKFHEEDIKIVESLLKALFYNLYDDNLSYDKTFLHTLSYVCSKNLHIKYSTNKTMINDRLVYCCLKNWYEKYYNYKKSIYNSYNNYFESIQKILDKNAYSYLSNIELLKCYPLNKVYSYYAQYYLREIKNKKNITNEIILSYKPPKYQDTDYDKMFKLSKQFIYATKHLLTIINYWIVLYNIQTLEKSGSVNNIVIHTKQEFDKHLIFSLEDMGFSDF